MPIVAEKYDVKGVLGEGGTGIVYDAVRTTDNAPVALKVMHEALAGDKQIRGRFQREAAILRRLEGDHVCKVLDFGEMPGEEPGTTLLYIAMPKITGEALSQIIQRAPLPVDRALEVMLEVLSALSAAHVQGVIHRDLKPANVLSLGGHWKLADFGISKNLSRIMTQKTFQQFGTLGYAAPEQFQGVEARPSADVYSLGKILVFLLTGQTDVDRVPFSTWRELIAHCIRHDPTQRPPIAKVADEIASLPT